MECKENFFKFDFIRSSEGWEGDFSDYPEGEEDFYELTWGWKPLPEPLKGRGIFISGNNHSDDLFMFIRRRLTSLKPRTSYNLTFTIRFATNAPKGCMGVGGPPGEGVTVKAGAAVIKPEPFISGNNHYAMNIDKGNQAGGGKDAVVLGDIANTNTDCHNWVYEMKQLENTNAPFKVTSGEDGAIWIVIGTDSGFEATTSLYYSNIEISAIEI